MANDYGSFYWPPQGGGGSGSGVSSLNTLTGAVVLAAGSNITLTPAGNTITIASTASGGANQTLSNLTNPTAINQNLTFGAGAGPWTIVTPNVTGSSASAGLQVLSGNTVNGTAGTVLFSGGDGTGSGNGGAATFRGGNAGGAGNGGSVRLQPGTSVSGNPGQILLTSDNGIALLPNTISSPPFLQFFEGTQNFNVSLKASSSLAGNLALTLPLVDGSSGWFLKTNGSGVLSFAAGNAGTVTAVSVASANGFTGSSSGGATPALTLSTSISGLLQGSSGALAAYTGGNLTEATSSILTITGGTGSQIGAGTSIQVKLAGTSQSGYLSSTDWNTFNGKQAAGNYITALTGDGTASGPGSSAFTLAAVNSNVGSFTNANITVDGKGRITAAANGSGGGFTDPMTSTGDMIYSSDNTPTPTRLPIGTANQALLVNVAGTAPSWSSGSQTFFAASSQVNTQSSSVTNSSFTTFSNSPSFTFTPTVSGTYKIYSNPALLAATAGSGVQIRIFNTSGSATLLNESQGGLYAGGIAGEDVINTFCQSVYTLVAGVSYQFDLQGKSASATFYLDGSNGGAFYMFAEQLNFNIISSVSSSLIGALVTYGVYS